jgi:hypothetical protein
MEALPVTFRYSRDRLRNFQLKPIVVKHTGWKAVELAPQTLNAENIVAKAGTRVVCPRCQAVIGRLFSDLYSGVFCRADQIEFVAGQTRRPDELAECKKCGEGYMKQSMSVANGTRMILSVEINGSQRWI